MLWTIFDLFKWIQIHLLFIYKLFKNYFMNITYDFFINIRRTKFKFYLKRDFIFIFIFIIWELYFDIDLFYILCNIYKVIQIVPQSETQSLASMHMTLNMDSCLFVSFPTFIDAYYIFIMISSFLSSPFILKVKKIFLHPQHLSKNI